MSWTDVKYLWSKNFVLRKTCRHFQKWADIVRRWNATKKRKQVTLHQITLIPPFKSKFCMTIFNQRQPISPSPVQCQKKDAGNTEIPDGVVGKFAHPSLLCTAPPHQDQLSEELTVWLWRFKSGLAATDSLQPIIKLHCDRKSLFSCFKISCGNSEKRTKDICDVLTLKMY